ncbi:thioesterase [Primorskyibacter flagellatus]|uniref:Thioesterase n=1 Tax=Primorskyibacter flagellatus TaxID=1387277 RepID=A0A917A9X4_9RHOB|nr:PaaI family thioesterase [Primorskyibacter flagellatus]GGE33927.1 thioesterase [Primorskyibacter flagellatus]
MDGIEARIRESFAKQTMMATFGAEVVSVAPGEVVLRAPIMDLAKQQMGFAHAALSFALGDTAAGYAALTTLPEGQEVVTAEIKINLLSPATGDWLVATGRVVKPGKRLAVVSAVVEAVTGDSRKDVALLQGSMMPI